MAQLTEKTQALRSNRLSRRRQRILALAPRVVAPFERPNARDPECFELQRRTGAGGFVRSRTVDHHVAVQRNVPDLLLQFPAIEPDCAGKFVLNFLRHS